jgi:hypothetical protein
MSPKNIVVLIALLSPVSCGNCADDKPREVQPGTPKDPAKGHDPAVRGLRVTPLKAMQDGAMSGEDAGP